MEKENFILPHKQIRNKTCVENQAPKDCRILCPAPEFPKIKKKKKSNSITVKFGTWLYANYDIKFINQKADKVVLEEISKQKEEIFSKYDDPKNQMSSLDECKVNAIDNLIKKLEIFQKSHVKVDKKVIKQERAEILQKVEAYRQKKQKEGVFSNILQEITQTFGVTFANLNSKMLDLDFINKKIEKGVEEEIMNLIIEIDSKYPPGLQEKKRKKEDRAKKKALVDIIRKLN